LISSLNPSLTGQSVTFTANVTANDPSQGTPIGNVTFTDTTTSQTLSTVNLTSGQAAFTTSLLAVGSHDIQATYNGDATFDVSTGSLTQIVNSPNTISTTTTIVSSKNPSTIGQAVTFTATVSGTGGTPTGSVTFLDQSTNQTLGTITVIGGAAVITTSTLAIGSHTIQASYGGDANFSARHP
jgi:Bacterial Ig-like domain (group 3)